MEVTLLKYPSNADWADVKLRALITANKTKVVNAPELEWKKKILKARHSPIRYLEFSFLIQDLPSWVATHLCRHHVGVQPYVSTQRNDRQKKYDRNSARQDYPVTMILDINAEALMTLANKRLCNQASKETRETVKKMCGLVVEKCPEFTEFLVPMCEYLGGNCPEMFPCGAMNYPEENNEE